MKKKLSTKQTLLVASTLFGMFFGAGNLIFPVHLGQMAGSNVWPATIGFIITAVSIPILGVAAIGYTHSDNLLTLSSKVSKWYGYVFTCALYLTIGPFFAIPRCCTTSFTTGVEPLLIGADISGPQIVFSFIFFALVLYFSLKPNEIMTWIGKIINPIFLVFLAILVVTALMNPTAAIAEVEPIESYKSGAFFNGFIEGYGTMDAIAGLAFGVIVTNIIRKLGVGEDSDVAKATFKSGIFTAILMALIYIVTIIVGTQSRGVFDVSENGGIALAQISNYYLGPAGMVILAGTITFACLKTAIGLVTSCAEIFVKMFPKTLNYKKWTIIFSAFSFAVANVGLTDIINYSIPVLMLLYPLAITIIILALCERLFNKSQYVYICVTIGAFAAAIFDFAKTLPEGIQSALNLAPAIGLAGKVFPFFDLGLGWIVPSLVGLVVGLIIMKVKALKQ